MREEKKRNKKIKSHQAEKVNEALQGMKKRIRVHCVRLDHAESTGVQDKGRVGFYGPAPGSSVSGQPLKV